MRSHLQAIGRKKPRGPRAQPVKLVLQKKATQESLKSLETTSSLTSWEDAREFNSRMERKQLERKIASLVISKNPSVQVQVQSSSPPKKNKPLNQTSQVVVSLVKPRKESQPTDSFWTVPVSTPVSEPKRVERKIRVHRVPGRWVSKPRDPHKYLEHPGRAIWSQYKFKSGSFVASLTLYGQLVSVLLRLFGISPMQAVYYLYVLFQALFKILLNLGEFQKVYSTL